MSFFDFVKDAGNKIFHTDAEAARQIKEHLMVRTSNIDNLEVEYDDGVVTLCGNCMNEKTKEGAVLLAGNIEGVEKVVADGLVVDQPKAAQPAAAEPTASAAAPAAEPAVDPAPAAAPAPEPETGNEYYTIEKGDTLSAIAQRYYGKASEYMRIFNANTDIISDPDKIYPGQKIRIPKD